MVRNKDGDFPDPGRIEDPKAKAENAPKRANGEIKDQPQQRMKDS